MIRPGSTDPLADIERVARDWTERQIAICGGHTTRARYLRAVEKRGLAYAKAVGLEDWQLIDEMGKAVDLFNDLALADVRIGQHKSLKDTGWQHQDVWEVFRRGLGSGTHREFYRGDIESIAGRLLAMEWLEMPYLEWAIVDCLIYNEIVKFADAIQGDWPGPKCLGGNLAHMLGGDFAAIRRAEWIWNAKLYAIWYLAIPAAAAAIYLAGLTGTHSHVLDERIVAAAVYLTGAGVAIGVIWALLTALHFSLRFSRFVLLVIGHHLSLGGSLAKFADEPIEPVHKGRMRLWEQMAKAYRLLEGAVLCPTMIHDELTKTKELGTVWSNSAFAIVVRAIRRNPSTWIVWPP